MAACRQFLQRNFAEVSVYIGSLLRCCSSYHRWSQYYLNFTGTMLEETITHLSSFYKTCSPIDNAFPLVFCKLKNVILLRKSEVMYTQTSAKQSCKTFLHTAIFLVLISPTGSYIQIKWAGTFAGDFLDPLSIEFNDTRLIIFSGITNKNHHCLRFACGRRHLVSASYTFSPSILILPEFEEDQYRRTEGISTMRKVLVGCGYNDTLFVVPEK